MNTDSFIVFKKTETIYVDTLKDVKTKFFYSNYEIERPLTLVNKIKNN